MTDVFVELLEEILGDHHSHNDVKSQISFDCPVCSHEIKGLDHGDGKGNLEINYAMGVYKCWACSETHDTYGTLYKLIKTYGNKKQLKIYELLRPNTEFDRNTTYKKVVLPKEYVEFTKVSLGLKLTHHYKQAFNYIKKRNITLEMCERYKIGFAYQGDYAGRIILPSYDADDELNYFVARSYLGDTKFKYKNPESQKEILIFNEHLINWDEEVFLVEGVFDSIFLPNSIPMLGKVLSEHLYAKLYDNAKKITIILDGDAWLDSVKIYHTINSGKLFNKISLIKLPIDKDLADLQGNISNFEKIQLD